MKRSKRSKKQKKEDFLNALRKSYGNITKACKAADIGRKTVYEYMKADKKFQAEVDEVNEEQLDESESQLFKAVRKGEGWAICFHLKCKGKKRGYVERQEITGADGEPLDVKARFSTDALEQAIERHTPKKRRAGAGTG